MTSTDTPKPSGRRLPIAERRAELVAAASLLVVKQGYLPISFDELGRVHGVSKALVYAHFQSQEDLANAILAERLSEFSSLAERRGNESLDDVAVEYALAFFDHVSTHGPVLHILLSDLHISKGLDRSLLRRRDRIIRRLARLARRDLGLSAEQTIAAINMVIAVPEEGGALVFNGRLDRDVGRSLCRSLVLSAIRGLRPEA